MMEVPECLIPSQTKLIESTVEIKRQVTMEKAKLARYSALTEEAARTLLTNRDLATDFIQRHSHHVRPGYAVKWRSSNPR
jgi:hypothetical protein